MTADYRLRLSLCSKSWFADNIPGSYIGLERKMEFKMTFRIALSMLWVLVVFLSPLGVLSISTAGGTGMVGVVESDADSDPNERVTVIVKVAGGISASDLCAELDSTCTTLHERRKKGVTLLVERAERTQAGALEHLRNLESLGLASDIEIKWLTNSISVDLAVSAMDAVASHPDVVDVFPQAEMHQIEPVYHKPALTRSLTYTGGAEDNLRFIGADSAWKMGYTGEGRIVCHLDGIEGAHPALYDNWKGHDGDSGAAWSGPGSFPTARRDHGTLVTGVMVGHDDETGDTIGVAPGAEWIAGQWGELEWAANPDGDPNSTDDVPDVIWLTVDHGASYRPS